MSRIFFSACLLFLAANLSAQSGAIAVKKADADTNTVYVRFGTILYEGFMTPAELAKVDSLEFHPASNWKIVSYVVSFASAGSFFETWQFSAKMDDTVKARLAQQQAGSKIYIEQISVEHRKTGEKRKLPSIVIRVQ